MGMEQGWEVGIGKEDVSLPSASHCGAPSYFCILFLPFICFLELAIMHVFKFICFSNEVSLIYMKFVMKDFFSETFIPLGSEKNAQ